MDHSTEIYPQTGINDQVQGDKAHLVSKDPGGLSGKTPADAEPLSKLWLALFDLRSDLEAQITEDFDPVLSRKLDALLCILEV